MERNELLWTVDWAERMFGSLTTNRQCPRRDVMRAVRAGLVKSVGMVMLCDDDGGSLDPERYREGFKLTDAGKIRLAELGADARRGEGGLPTIEQVSGYEPVAHPPASPAEAPAERGGGGQ